MIKMIVTDLDGTLLNNESKLTPYTIEVLEKAQKQGVIMVLSSGRSHITLTDFASQLNMFDHNGYLICVNGLSRYKCADKSIHYLQKISKEEELELFNQFKDSNVEIMGVNDDYLYDYIPEEYLKEKLEYKKANNLDFTVNTGGPKAIVHDQTKNKYRVYDVENFDNNEPVNKVVAGQNKEVLDEAIAKVPNEVKERFTFNRTSNMWLEIAPKGVSKGNNLRTLAEELGIKMDEIMVFGDGENDLSMLTIVENSVCMLNGMDSVKEKVKYITEFDNHNDGVAHFVAKYVLNQ